MRLIMRSMLCLLLLSGGAVVAEIKQVISLDTAVAQIVHDLTRQAKRVISLDAAITEIIHALGASERLVGTDSAGPRLANHIPELKDVANVGYKRRLSAEGVLALQPDVILATDDVGPPTALTQITAAGVKVTTIPDKPTIAGLHETIRAVALELNVVEAGEALIERIDAEMAEARDTVASMAADNNSPPRVLFLLVIGSGSDMSGGHDTVADTMIELAGGINVMQAAFMGYKPISAEAVVAAAPDVVLVAQRNFDSLGGREGILSRVGLASTPAGQAGRIVTMDGLLLLGLGPRTSTAVVELSQQLYAASAQPSQ